MPTIELTEDVFSLLTREADRSHAGDVPALISSSVTMFRELTDPLQLLPGPLAPSAAPGAADAEVIRQLATRTSVSTESIVRLGDAFLAAAGQVRDARSGAASQYLAPFLAWVAQSPSGRALAVSLTSTQAATGNEGLEATGVVSVATGFLQGDGNLVRGTLAQVFSDRRTPQNLPFDPTRTDRLGLEIVGSPDKSGFSITLIAESWGGGRQTLRDANVTGGVLTAVGDSVGNVVPVALYTLCLATTTIPG